MSAIRRSPMNSHGTALQDTVVQESFLKKNGGKVWRANSGFTIHERLPGGGWLNKSLRIDRGRIVPILRIESQVTVGFDLAKPVSSFELADSGSHSHKIIFTQPSALRTPKFKS